MAPNTASSLPALPAFNPARLRSYLLRLPLFTRGIIVAITFFWLLELQTVWSVTQWGSLIPKEIGLGTSTFMMWRHARCFASERMLIPWTQCTD